MGGEAKNPAGDAPPSAHPTTVQATAHEPFILHSMEAAGITTRTCSARPLGRSSRSRPDTTGGPAAARAGRLLRRRRRRRSRRRRLLLLHPILGLARGRRSAQLPRAHAQERAERDLHCDGHAGERDPEPLPEVEPSPPRRPHRRRTARRRRSAVSRPRLWRGAAGLATAGHGMLRPRLGRVAERRRRRGCRGRRAGSSAGQGKRGEKQRDEQGGCGDGQGPSSRGLAASRRHGGGIGCAGAGAGGGGRLFLELETDVDTGNGVMSATRFWVPACGAARRRSPSRPTRRVGKACAVSLLVLVRGNEWLPLRWRVRPPCHDGDLPSC